MKWKTKSLFDGTLPLRKKLIIVYLLAAVLPILIITIMISAIYYRSILENAFLMPGYDNDKEESDTVTTIIVDQDNIILSCEDGTYIDHTLD
ncbi:MAG: hypothetical protein SOY73_03535 [Blautia sp.]|nr:hypothetical protein [Blautia sp.]MDY3998179.1 hypothetical protein [Blautia sp.]